MSNADLAYLVTLASIAQGAGIFWVQFPIWRVDAGAVSITYAI